MRAANSGGSSTDIFLQQIYTKLDTLPIVNRYLRKIRRRLELVNQNDEYMLRRNTAKITVRSILLTLGVSILIAWLNKDNLFIMITSLLGVLIVIENMTEQMINKVENRLLEQELEFFSEVRHAFHVSNMVEEAIYDASLREDSEIVSQANTTYDILISADPEIELEKYYDVAPNRFLKIFAGVSYLTKEFGDRKVGGISLYLKDMNNITQELQLEVLKRDKLDYLFKSLTYIAVAPILLINPLKAWALSAFASTASFYEGKTGFLCEVILIASIFLSYSLIVRIKDNEDNKIKYSSGDAWQERVYRLPVVEKFIDGLVPGTDKPALAKVNRLLQDTASTLKIEWLYINKVMYFIIAFFVTLLIVNQMHRMAIEDVLYGDTVESDIMGQMAEVDVTEAQTLTASDRFFITGLLDSEEIVKIVREKEEIEAIQAIKSQMYIMNSRPLSDEKAAEIAAKIYRYLTTERSKHVSYAQVDLEDAILKAGIEMPRNNFVVQLAREIVDVTKDDGRFEITEQDIAVAAKVIYSIELTEEQLSTTATRIYEKLKNLTSEYFKWTELLVSILVAMVAYMAPNMILVFQKKMRQMDMDNEVMQFQTIILMLMHIERVSVEYILDWLGRFSNIFREPLQRCINNYESGAFEALEQLKDEVSFKPFIRIVESLQSAVENVKITDAFDELESERAFFQEKRKEANERLIEKKARIGKFIGFTPMILLFVGYLIVPLIWTSVGNMGTYFNQMSSML